jgi:hypothetical protein
VNVTFATSQFAPVVLGFFGLGTGYLIYGPQELLRFPSRNASVDRATGIWGIWMPGFCQFATGVYLFIALTWFESLREPALYTAAFAFSAYGIHWFALGWNRYQQNDVRPTGLMSISFIIISVLGAWVFFSVGTWAVGVLFLGLIGVYVSEFLASFQIGVRRPFAQVGGSATGGATAQGGAESAGGPGAGGGAQAPVPNNPGERLLGFFHIATGLWLMYLMFATTLNISLHYTLPAG